MRRRPIFCFFMEHSSRIFMLSGVSAKRGEAQGDVRAGLAAALDRTVMGADGCLIYLRSGTLPSRLKATLAVKWPASAPSSRTGFIAKLSSSLLPERLAKYRIGGLP